jgi:hypothetical protein
VFRTFRYKTLNEVSQENFGIDSKWRPYAWLILPVFGFLAFLMVHGAFDTFETGKTDIKGGRQISGQAAYLQAAFMALTGSLLLLLPIKGPKWFAIVRRCIWAVIAVAMVWSIFSAS